MAIWNSEAGVTLGCPAKNGQSGVTYPVPIPTGRLQDSRQELRDGLCALKYRDKTAQPCYPGWCDCQMAGWYWCHSVITLEGKKCCAFCCSDEGFANTGVLCQHLLQPGRLVGLVYSKASTALLSTHIPWRELKEHFQQPPITVLITRDYQVPQNRPQASFCMQTSNDCLVPAGRPLFRVSSTCLYITHHCQLPLNNDTLKHCCACTAHSFQKRNIMLSELSIWRFWKDILILIISGFFQLLSHTWPFMW